LAKSVEALTRKHRKF